MTRRLYCILAFAITLAYTDPSHAQVGDIQLPYPGWVPSDRVAPEVDVTETYDATRSLWTYSYTVGNGIAAEQDIWEVSIRLGAWVTDVQTPNGWRSHTRVQETFDSTLGINATTYSATLPPGPLTTNYWPASPYQIHPGSSLSGFVQESPYPPGYSRTYVQGYAQVPFEPDPRNEDERDAYYAMNSIPHDTTNSQRGWTLGPTRYTQVLTTGDGGPTDSFLGFMNLRLTPTQLMDPAPIAIKFPVGTETVFPETLQIKLNETDVTAAFLPGPPDGATRVAVFRLGSSPLQEGANVLRTSIEGIIPGTAERAADIDVITFTVIPQ